jgi:uncharacterized protein YndB with AHSA1/START domain
MEQYDWSRFVTRIAVNATREELYKAWATRKGIEYWFLRMADYRSADGVMRGEDEYVSAGDTYSWRWHGWPDEMEEHGTILSCNGKDQFRFTFGKAGICSVSLYEERGQMMMELIQTEIPVDDQGKHNFHLGCKTGWTFYLTNMKSLFEGGIDLRNRDEGLKNVVNS